SSASFWAHYGAAWRVGNIPSAWRGSAPALVVARCSWHIARLHRDVGSPYRRVGDDVGGGACRIDGARAGWPINTADASRITKRSYLGCSYSGISGECRYGPHDFQQRAELYHEIRQSPGRRSFGSLR